ncbi:MAG: glutathione S-transferase family protein [Gammaproteobacteria bacterium]|nr:glutathione S-transferase family protein [Gammaproteobacteria bacterium]
MIQIYGQVASRAARCLWAASEIGLEFEHVKINQQAGESLTPEYLQINPNGRVPALVDGDLVLCESMAINLYLADKYGPALWFKSPEQRALATQWSFWSIFECELNIVTMLQHRVFLPQEQRDETRAAEAEAALPKALEVLDAALAGKQFLIGDKFSIADLNVASVLVFAKLLEYDYSPYSNLSVWLGNSLSRPALAQVENYR